MSWDWKLEVDGFCEDLQIMCMYVCMYEFMFGFNREESWAVIKYMG